MGLLDKAARKNSTGALPKARVATIEKNIARNKLDAGREAFLTTMIGDLGGIGSLLGIRIRSRSASPAQGSLSPIAQYSVALRKALGEDCFLHSSGSWVFAFCDPEIPWDPELYNAQLGQSLRASLTPNLFKDNSDIETRAFNLADPNHLQDLSLFLGA